MKTYTFFQVCDLLGEAELIACACFRAENMELAKEKFKQQTKENYEGSFDHIWRQSILMGDIWIAEGDHKGAFAFEDKEVIGMVPFTDSAVISTLN